MVERGCTEWRADLLGDTTDRYNYNDGKNVFQWISSSWPNMLGDVNSVIGVTMPVWSFDGAIVDADMVFNDVGFCWNDTGNNGCVDTQSIATHEEGHFLGLGHSQRAERDDDPLLCRGLVDAHHRARRHRRRVRAVSRRRDHGRERGERHERRRRRRQLR